MWSDHLLTTEYNHLLQDTVPWYYRFLTNLPSFISQNDFIHVPPSFSSTSLTMYSEPKALIPSCMRMCYIEARRFSTLSAHMHMS